MLRSSGRAEQGRRQRQRLAVHHRSSCCESTATPSCHPTPAPSHSRAAHFLRQRTYGFISPELWQYSSLSQSPMQVTLHCQTCPAGKDRAGGRPGLRAQAPAAACRRPPRLLQQLLPHAPSCSTLASAAALSACPYLTHSAAIPSTASGVERLPGQARGGQDALRQDALRPHPPGQAGLQGRGSSHVAGSSPGAPKAPFFTAEGPADAPDSLSLLRQGADTNPTEPMPCGACQPAMPAPAANWCDGWMRLFKMCAH